jgi:phosphatidate cytidylyltransferase
MLRDRLWTGSLLAALMLGSLAGDSRLAPWFPLLYAVLALVGFFACRELLALIPQQRRPSAILCHFGIQAIVLANWIVPIREQLPDVIPKLDPWHAVLGVFTVLVLTAFLVELRRYDGSGEAGARIAWTCFVLIYLGVLAAFLAQLRWLPRGDGRFNLASLAMLLAIFVPKCSDIGAYATGRLIGKTPFTPKLSPKKTWEGSIGGLLVAVVVAVIGGLLGAQPAFWWLKAIGFGFTVGLAGMMGDLAESLLKREAQAKDASTAIPGFGGILDVVDSVLFAAPVAYAWLAWTKLSPISSG